MRITLDQTAALLDAGQIAAIPTETVYGLAARIDRPSGIEQIFARKGRPRDNPLIVHLAEIAHLDPLVTLPRGCSEMVRRLVERFWPGPLTLLLPVRERGIAPAVRAGSPLAGFRVPRHALTRELLRRTGPLAAPSANPAGRPSPTLAEHVERDFGGQMPILDAGPCSQGIESTILGWSDQRLLLIRRGAVSEAAICAALDLEGIEVASGEIASPGSRYRHYAPSARLTRNPIGAVWHGAVLGFADREYPGSAQLISLGASSDDAGVAKNLFAALRQLDEEKISSALLDFDLPRGGLWPSIADRLLRASADLAEK